MGLILLLLWPPAAMVLFKLLGMRSPSMLRTSSQLCPCFPHGLVLRPWLCVVQALLASAGDVPCQLPPRGLNALQSGVRPDLLCLGHSNF